MVLTSNTIRMKSWVFFAIFALILLFLLHNRTLEVEQKLSEDGLKKGSRFLFIERIVYESELTIETDPIIDSNHVLDADYSQEYVQQKSVQSQIMTHSDGNSGIDLRTTRKAFDYWIPMALKYATTAAVQVVHIPPIVKKKTNIRVTVKDLRVSHADILLDSYQLAAPDLIILSLVKGSMVLNGGYEVKVKLPPVKKHGSITIILNDVSFKFAVQLSKNPQGILQAQIRQCSSSVGSIKIKVGNDIVRGLFNMYKGEFKSQANQHICQSLGQLVGMANSLLVKQTSFYNLPGGLKFDYGLIKNPEAHDAFLDFGLKGVFETAIESQMEKMSGLLSPVTDAPKRMALANIPDFTFNSFLFQATKAGLFNEVHLERMNNDIKHLLRLTCTEHERCIGRFSPNMSSAFVDTTGELILKIVTSPTVNISQNGAALAFDLKFELRYQRRTFQSLLEATAPAVVLSFDLSATVNITSITVRKASRAQNNVTATAGITSISTSNVQPKVAAMEPLAILLPIAISVQVPNLLKQALGQGFAFSSGKYFNFDADITLQDHALSLDIDFMKILS